jgi:uncharacterized protein YcnI
MLDVPAVRKVRMRARMHGRVATVLAAGALGLVALAGPAAAHVEVSADTPQAGARNVTLTFVGEAESSRAGIASERVVLPAGITPQDVALVKAPAGWKLTANPDGFTVAGSALPVGQDATFAVTVAKLPVDATKLAFKTVETYGDGKVSRWIEIPQEGAAEPDNPAPMLTVRAAAMPPGADPGTPAPAPTAAGPSAAPTTAQAASSSKAEDGTWWPLWVAGGVAVVVVAGAVALILRRRRGGPDGVTR